MPSAIAILGAFAIVQLTVTLYLARILMRLGVVAHRIESGMSAMKILDQIPHALIRLGNVEAVASRNTSDISGLKRVFRKAFPTLADKEEP